MGEPRPARFTLGRVGLALLIAINLALGSIGLTTTAPAVSAAAPATLLISELLPNPNELTSPPNSTDSPYEWVELLATGAIDFSVTPYSVIVVNNGTATANGWIAGGAITYGFSITSGTVSKGEVVYVGGSLMYPTGRKLRTIDTRTVNGDRFGNANTAGVFGNGGGNADAVGVFAENITNITNATVPVDALFFGTGTGNAVVSGGTAGYQLPDNDRYDGGKLQSGSFVAPDAGGDDVLRATGVYDLVTGTFTTARTWAMNDGVFTDGASAIAFLGEEPPPPPPYDVAAITGTFTLPDLGLGATQNADLPGSITNDRNLLLGGTGSDLWHSPGDPADTFWMITDRGPNGEVEISNENRRTFPVPNFTPTILKVRVSGTAITVLETIPIVTQGGDPVTGLANLDGHNSPNYDVTGQSQLPFNQNGIDSEGMVRASDGTFWVAEEYGPSILHVAADGKVIKRWMPAGLDLPNADYPVDDTLPAILGVRKDNRGFEGLGLAPDGRTLYAAVQSPLSNPDQNAGEASRLIRILAFDTASEAVIGEYVYQQEVGATFDPANPGQDEMKTSALVVVDADTLLIQERTDPVARLYIAELSGATNILGSQWDNPATSPSLEALADPTTEDIAVLPKTLRVDLERLPDMPDKIEGVALVDCTRIAVANDNDFDIGDFDQDGNNIGAGLKSKILTIGLAEPITPGCVDTQVRTPIHDIQGASHTSPLVGQLISGAQAIEGIVVATRSNGIYVQEEDIDADINPATSEAIFVFTGTGHGRAVGDKVTVTGTVSEFRPGNASGTNNLTVTQIGMPGRAVTLISTNNPLPTATVIGAGGRVPPTTIIDNDTEGSVEEVGQTTFDPNEDGIDFYESLEGMRVQINNAVAVGPTNDFGEIPVLADNGGNSAGTRTARGGIVIQPGDFNPERIILDDLIVGTANIPKVNVGTTFPGAVLGVMDYDFGNFKFLVTTNPVATDTTNAVVKETSTITVGANQFTVATFNVENLHPGNPQSKFDGLAAIIVNNLHSPDIIAVEEVQDNDGPDPSPLPSTPSTVVAADQTYAKLIATISSMGGPTYTYRQIDPSDNTDGGEPGGNIRVGFLYRTDRGVSFVDRPGGDTTTAVGVVAGPYGPELTQSPGRIDPTNPAFATSRKPLAGEFMFNGNKLFLIGNHFNSKGGDQPLFGRFQPPTLTSEAQRVQQAQIVRSFVDDILAIDQTAKVIVLGDINDFQFSTPFTILEGSGATQMYTLIESLPLNERYSYVFDGNSQALDHIMVSPNLFTDAAFLYDIVHVNAEFSPQNSDHDPQLVRFTLAPTAPFAADFSATVAEDTAQTILLRGTAAGNGPLVYSIVAGPANGTLGAINGNQITYTPNADYTGPDTFTYKVTENGADSAIATVAITVSTTNDPPVAGNGTVNTPADTAATVAMAATDPENASLTYTIVTPPAHGTLGTITGNRVTYTPTAGYSGPDTFTFRANDGTNNSNVATISITVVAPPPPPTFTLTVATTGNGTVTPSTGPQTAGSTVTLQATPDTGSTFIGWTVDNALAGLDNPLTLTMGSAHTVTATFAATPNFSDIAGSPHAQAIRTLAAYGAIRGYGDGTFGPADEITRAEMAALIVRGMGWNGENHGNPFNDRGGLNEELWRSVGTLAWYGVAFGYGNGAFGPNDEVQYLQSISFITRAMIAKGYWVKAQANDPTLYPNVAADSPHRLDLVTYVQNAGALPTFGNATSAATLQQPATRGWYAAALLQALESRFATTP